MRKAIAVRSDYTSREVRRLAKQSNDAWQARRLLAIAAVLDGTSREEAAKIGGMARQTLRDWVIRFNDEGPQDLRKKPSPGAPGKLGAKHKEFPPVSPTRDRSRRLMAWCAGGPATWSSNCTLSSVCRYRIPRFIGPSRNWVFRHVSARPKAYRQDPDAIEAFKKISFPERVAEVCEERALVHR